MFVRRLLFVVGSIALINGAFIASAQDKASSSGKTRDQKSVRYDAEEGLPGDKAGEKRRDYAVLEAALNDLASPKNPENKIHIENVGLGREIVIDDQMCSGDLSSIALGFESRNNYGEDPRRIPADIQEDFKRRSNGPARSLRDFKPANPDILVRDLDKMFDQADDPLGAFREAYPNAWGYVWAYPPGYSGDGKSALVVFEGGPNGIHGLNWKYMLTRDRNRWLVVWRHCHPRE